MCNIIYLSIPIMKILIFFININKCLAPISYFQIMEVGPKYLSYHFNCSNIHQGKQNLA